ncbi:MAG: hypothetical protein WAO58_01055 [Fimbriimonadaceae bacterium]
MRRLALWLAAAFLAVVLGCGGGVGGGGGGPQVLGRVLNVETGGPTNPRSSVQIGSESTLTSASDGSFTLAAALGTSSLSVDTLSAFGVWIFSFPPISGTTDIGDLWVGPEKVAVTGFVRNAATNDGIAGATVVFAGRYATTDVNGQFSLAEVAYSSTNQAAFWGIAGFARHPDFVATEWSAQPHVALGGVVTVDDILLTPNSDPNPPPPPFNIWGRVSPANDAPGTVATLKENGVAVRVVNVGGDGIYRFWAPPGTYTIDFEKGLLSDSHGPFTITDQSEVYRYDATLQ